MKALTPDDMIPADEYTQEVLGRVRTIINQHCRVGQLTEQQTMRACVNAMFMLLHEGPDITTIVRESVTDALYSLADKGTRS